VIGEEIISKVLLPSAEVPAEQHYSGKVGDNNCEIESVKLHSRSSINFSVCGFNKQRDTDLSYPDSGTRRLEDSSLDTAYTVS